MSYTKRTDLASIAKTGETIVQLDSTSGQLVAVKCDVATGVGIATFTVSARAIDESGTAIADAAGNPVVASPPALRVPISVVTAETPDAIAKQCLMLVLGESGTRSGWSSDYLAAYSIRTALAAASIATVSAGTVL